MNKKGIVLAVTLVVIAVLSVIIVLLFTRAVNERNLVSRHTNTAKAFWLAEAGVSKAYTVFPGSVGLKYIEEEQGCPSRATCFYESEKPTYECAVPDVDPGFVVKKEMGIIEYVFNGSTFSSPGSGKLSLNNGNLENVSELYVSKEDSEGIGVSDKLSEIDKGHYVVVYRTDGGVVECEIVDDGIGKVVYEIDSVSEEAGYFTYKVSNFSSPEGDFFDGRDVRFVFVRPNLYEFNDSTDPSPDSGKLSLNNSVLEDANKLYVNIKDKAENDITDKLSAIDNQYYTVITNDDGIGKVRYEVISVSEENSYFTYGLSNFSSPEDDFTGEDEVKLVFVHQDLITGLMEVNHYEYYRIVSLGTVDLSTAGKIEKEIIAFMSVGIPPSSNFPYAIESTGDISIQGNAYEIDPEDSQNTYTTLNFEELFGVSKEEAKNGADYLYDDTDNFTGDGVEVAGLTWVEVSSGGKLTIAGNFEGEGVLIVNGDCDIAGTESFNGIIYVIGELTMSGNSSMTGSILAESATDIDTTLSGNITITHDEGSIKNALDSISHLGGKSIISWQQTQ